jgi:glycerol-3-phosphate acyltransferase PlsY
MSWLLIIAAYLLGSVSFAWIAAKSHGIDLRQHGSGNLGATNVGRVLGKKWFFIVFSADLLKGLLPVLVALSLVKWHGAHATLPVLVGAGSILGHIFTCFHGFKGGKAVATALGVLIALVYISAAIAFCVWLIVWALGVLAFRNKTSEAVGPASVAASFAVPIAHLSTYPQPWSLLNLPLTIFIMAVATLVIVRHRANIVKMFAGKKD